MNIPNAITKAIVAGLIAKLDLDESQCFPSIMPILDTAWEGDRLIQVVPGATQPYGAGQGAQAGGADLERQSFTLYVYYRLNLDPHGRSDEILTEQARGILDYFENIKAIFRMTVLGGLLFERMWYEGESPTAWEDPESGIVRRSITYACTYGVDLPTTMTL